MDTTRKFRYWLSNLFTLNFIDLSLRVIAILCFYLFFAWYFYENADFKWEHKLSIIALFFVPVLAYFFSNFLFLKRRKANKTRENKKSGDLRNRHFVSFLALLIFYISSVAGLVIFNAKPTNLLVQNLNPGTVGIRSWYCEVVVEELEIYHLDSNGYWRQIPEEIVWTANNWTGEVMHENRNLVSAEAPKHYSFCEKQKKIFLANCAAIFMPPDSVYSRIFKDFKVKAKVTFTDLDGNKRTYPGFHILAFVTPYLEHTNCDQNAVMFSELHLQFNFNYFDNAAPWIPELNWAPAIINRSKKSDLQKHGGFLPTLKKNKAYSLSAIVFNDQVLFLGHAQKPDIKTVTLFESKIESSN